MTGKPVAMDVPENVSTEKEFCFVCDENIKDDGICLSIEKTDVSKTLLPDKISYLVGESYMVIISEDDKLCSRCISLINKYDELETLLLEVKNTIVTLLKKKYDLDDEGITQEYDSKETPVGEKELSLNHPKCQIYDQLKSLKKTSSPKIAQEPLHNSMNSLNDNQSNETEVAIKCETCFSTMPADCCQQSQTNMSFDVKLLQANTCEFNVHESNGIEQIIMTKEVKIEHNENIENHSCQRLNNAEKFIPDRVNQEITKVETQNLDETLYEHTCSSVVNIPKPVKVGKTNVSIRGTKQTKSSRQQLRPILPRIANLNDLANVVQLDTHAEEKKNVQTNRNVKLHDKGVLNLRDHPELSRKTCKICRIDFETQEQFQTHEKAHSNGGNGLCCSFCGKNFKTFSGVRDHTVNRHTKKFAFYCDFCGRGFTTRARLEDHRSGHTQESRWVCDVCGKRFNHQSTYWIHKKWHTEPLPYQCDSCGRRFKHTSLLAVHRRNHTGERPYKCAYCTLTFTNSSSCKRHTILHTRKYPFHCHTCHVGFTARFKYTAHMAKTHGKVDRTAVGKTDFKMAVYEPVVETSTELQITQDDHSNSTGSVYKLPYLEDSSPNNSEHLSDNVVEVALTPTKSKSLLHDGLISQVWLQ